MDRNKMQPNDKDRYIKKRDVTIQLRNIDNRKVFATVSTEALLSYFAILPMNRVYTDRIIENATEIGDDLIDFAIEIDDDDHRKFMIFIIFLVAKLMKIDTLLERAEVKLVQHLLDKEQIETIDTPHFRKTVLSFMDNYLEFMLRFLSKVGIEDSVTVLKGVEQIKEALARKKS